MPETRRLTDTVGMLLTMSNDVSFRVQYSLDKKFALLMIQIGEEEVEVGLDREEILALRGFFYNVGKWMKEDE